MFGRKKRKSSESEIESAPGSPGYLTWIISPHKLISKYHSEPIGPGYKYNGTIVHLAQCKPGTDDLERYIQPSPPETFPRSLQSPEGLFNALDWRLARPVYRVEDSAIEKLQTGLMFGLLGVLLFFLYLIFTNIQG